MKKEFNKIAKGAADLLYPRRCPICFDIVQPRGELICPECAKELVPVKSPACKKCGKTVNHERVEYCLDCTKHPKTFEYNMAVFEYNDNASRSMSAIKYKNKREYLDFYTEAAWFRYKKGLRALHAHAVISVPVHPARQRARGFNQAAILARGLSERLQLPVCEKALVRSRKTLPQKELNPEERLKNLRQAFKSGKILPGTETVLLVDDIYTTGSTLEACTHVLKTMGIRRVYTLTLFIGRGA